MLYYDLDYCKWKRESKKLTFDLWFVFLWICKLIFSCVKTFRPDRRHQWPSRKDGPEAHQNWGQSH